MAKLTPSEVIHFRAECYRNMDGLGVYSLYSDRSELARLFTPDSFAEHFPKQIKNCSHAGITMVSEKTRGAMAEVKYIEHILEGRDILAYYSKTILIAEDGGWKILKEQREVRKNAISVNI